MLTKQEDNEHLIFAYALAIFNGANPDSFYNEESDGCITNLGVWINNLHRAKLFELESEAQELLSKLDTTDLLTESEQIKIVRIKLDM